jgi:high-affinity Fe2+/Pb2+ permease
MSFIATLVYFINVYAMPEIYNFSNFSRDGIFRVAFTPYVNVMENMFWGALFGIIGIAIYVNERSIGTTAIYLILVGVFVAIVFPSSLAAIFGLILAFLLAAIFYKAFIENTI